MRCFLSFLSSLCFFSFVSLSDFAFLESSELDRFRFFSLSFLVSLLCFFPFFPRWPSRSLTLSCRASFPSFPRWSSRCLTLPSQTHQIELGTLRFLSFSSFLAFSFFFFFFFLASRLCGPSLACGFRRCHSWLVWCSRLCWSSLVCFSRLCCSWSVCCSRLFGLLFFLLVAPLFAFAGAKPGQRFFRKIAILDGDGFYQRF